MWISTAPARPTSPTRSTAPTGRSWSCRRRVMRYRAGVDAVFQWQHEALNLDSSTMAVNGLAATLYGLQLKMDVQGNDISKAPSYTGTLKIERFTPRDVLKALGRTLFTNTRDP